MSEIDNLTASLCRALAALPDAERIDALNSVRAQLHEVSPFADEPIDLVQWVRAETVRGNDYNPNAVAPPEMELLKVSVLADGYTQPIVTCPMEDGREIVDGYHRNRVGREVADVRERLQGYLPVTSIKVDRASRADRMAATVRHNRARGVHGVEGMKNIVRELHLAGYSDKQIQKELGMEVEEVVRLKQITGLAALFADRDFTEAWEPV